MKRPEIPEILKQKPIEVVAAFTLVAVGIGVSALSHAQWIQGLGGAVCAVGGALFSFVAVDTNQRKKAVDLLKPELQAMSRHLANSVMKITNNIRMHESRTIDPAQAIDRISQLSGALYGAVTDLDILVGVPPDVDTLVDLVTRYEETSKQLEQLTVAAAPDDSAKQERDRLLAQLESYRMQLASASKVFRGVESSKSEEQVSCPTCDTQATVTLGTAVGDSQVHTCTGCNLRFHIHRDSQGKAYTRPWGGTPSTHIEVACPSCKGTVPLNFRRDKAYEDRYCMLCACLLRITADGAVTKIKGPAPVRVDGPTQRGSYVSLRCPKCVVENPSIWYDAKVIRAVCRSCGDLLECAKTGAVQASSPTPTGAIVSPAPEPQNAVPPESIHRDSQGKPYAQPSRRTATMRLEVTCPNCQGKIPLNFRQDKSYEDRYCMMCASLLKITADGAVTKIKDPAPVRVDAPTQRGFYVWLKCPKCVAESRSIWYDAKVIRAVCRSCGDLLECVKTGAVQALSPAPTNAVVSPAAEPHQAIATDT